MPWILLKGWESQAKAVKASKTDLLTTLTTKEDRDTLAPKTSSEHRGIMVLSAGTTVSGSATFVVKCNELKLNTK